MLRTLLRWSNRFVESGWTLSEFGALPQVTAIDDQAERDYGLVLGGLALVLSRCSGPLAIAEFSSTLTAYRTLKHQLSRGRQVYLPAILLMEASHEVAEYADAATRAAMRRCLERSRGSRSRRADACKVPQATSAEPGPSSRRA